MARCLQTILLNGAVIIRIVRKHRAITPGCPLVWFSRKRELHDKWQTRTRGQGGPREAKAGDILSASQNRTRGHPTPGASQTQPFEEAIERASWANSISQNRTTAQIAKGNYVTNGKPGLEDRGVRDKPKQVTSRLRDKTELGDTPPGDQKEP